MHEDFLREITVKACKNKEEAMTLLRAVMAGLPDYVITNSIYNASELLDKLKKEIVSGSTSPEMLKAFTHMFHELTNEVQNRALHRMVN